MAVTFLTDADRAELERMILEHTGGAVTIESVLQWEGSGGYNVVTFSDGTELRVQNGKDGGVGPMGPEGPAGIGMPGKDGYTPVRGVDYWTEADQAAIVQQVLAALGQ